jgi:hypothetical protein
MKRSEIEAKLCRHRATLLEALAALPDDVISKGITASQHDGSVQWSAKDHLAHLAGIEKLFNAIIRRHLAGDPSPIQLPKDSDGNLLPREQIMPMVHEMNDGWIDEHRDKSFSDIVALGQMIRSDTLALLSSLTDEQLLEKIPGAPWADGTVGGVISVNGDHSRLHHDQVSKALAAMS